MAAGLVVCASVSLAADGIAAGESPAGDESDLASLIELLDSPNLATREQATTRLSRRSDFGIQTIESLLRENQSLSPEQRMRLFAAGRETFLRGPHAGMGIQFGQRLQNGVQIVSTVAGFDAARVLRPNDVIMSIDGRPISSREQISSEIISRAPGETMELKIERNGRELAVSLEMGSYEDLRNPPIARDRLERAWLVRLARNGMRDPLGVEPALAPGADSLAGTMTMILNQRSAMARIDPDARTLESWLVNTKRGLTGGGTPRGGVDRFDQPRTRIGAVDASLHASDSTAPTLETNDNIEKFTLAINAFQMAQATIRQIERDFQNRIGRTTDPDERSVLAEGERTIALAGRRINEWYQTWAELERSGEFDE